MSPERGISSILSYSQCIFNSTLLLPIFHWVTFHMLSSPSKSHLPPMENRNRKRQSLIMVVSIKGDHVFEGV